MTEHAISIRGLTKTYRGRAVLGDVTLDIRFGETLALLGANGAGKSTTVEILEGYRRRSGGEVSVLGVDPEHGDGSWRARLGIVLQSGGVAAPVTVRELLHQFAGYYPRSRDVDEVIAAVGLQSQARTRVARLSGGQQRRVDVALGIIGCPEVLFLDEPTTGFDPHARREFWQLIKNLQREGTTIVLTTHYLDEAAQLADRIAVLAGGRIAEVGPVATFGGEQARIPVVRWYADGNQHQHRTTEPLAFATELAREHGAEPAQLEIVRPSLEDVYLDLLERAEDPQPVTTKEMAS